jgi:hypothetical protein
MIILSSAIQKGEAEVSYLSEQTEDLYSKLIAMSPDSARKFLSHEDRNQFEACEKFLRSLEITIKSFVEDDKLPDLVSDEMKHYREIIARARLLAAKLNGYSKQLNKMPTASDDKISYDGLDESASYTAGKFGKNPLH